MIVGQEILNRQLIQGGSTSNLKHSTFDLTIGAIFPMGKTAARKRARSEEISEYFLEPREMVWILSKESFNMSPSVTGIATLRTSFTKDGILALNVGIIDPMFKGPISTALINFSDRPRRIALGDKFFRVIFIEHADVSAHHHQDENLDIEKYTDYLKTVSYADFSKNFLNVPEFNDKFYQEKFSQIFWYGITKNLKFSIPAAIFIVIFGWFMIHLGMVEFYKEKALYIKQIIPILNK